MNIRKYVFRKIVIGLCIISTIFVLLSSSAIIFISSKQLKELNIDILTLNKFYLVALVFAIISLIVELFVLKNVVKAMFFKAEKTVAIALTKENVKLPKTGIYEFDLLLAKLKTETKGICSRFCEINDNKGRIVGVFEIDKAKKKALTNEEMLKILDIDKFKKEGNVFAFPADSFDSLINNIQKFSYPKENNLFFVDYNGSKTWLKAFVAENDKYAVGFFADETKRMEEKALDLNNKEANNFTNMYSREYFISKAEKEMKENPKAIGCFATIELDNLKAINDTYGYKIGDMYIQAAEKAMLNINNDCIFGKKSGYEFLLYFYDYTSREKIRERIEAWIAALDKEKFIAPDKREYKFKVTSGYCFFPDDGDNVEKLMRYSSYALYEARTMFYGSIHAFSLEAYNHAAYIENKVKRFHEIVENNTFNYVFQPIVNLNDSSIFGYEALMRTSDEVLKNPKEILEIAKSEKMQYAVEKLTIFNCLKVVQDNFEEIKNKRFFYNTISNQMLTNEDINKSTSQYSEVGHCLVAEISENDEENYFFKKCGAIKDIDAKICIDNYTGKYIDFEKILKVNPNYIKIDASLVRDINLKKDSQTLISKLVKVAKERRITTIALGIETYDELRTIVKLGVDLGQGFYIAKPSKDFIKHISLDISNEIEDINSYI